MKCPFCARLLVQVARSSIVTWDCRSCGGCVATIAALRKVIRHDSLQRAWNRTMGAKRNGQLRCPDCTRTMFCVPTEGPEIDVCRGCQLMWFDAGELDEMPHRSEAEIEAAQRAEDWKRERREWRRRRERQEEFVRWLYRHPIGFISG